MVYRSIDAPAWVPPTRQKAPCVNPKRQKLPGAGAVERDAKVP
jgi:hypothetical protein